MRQFLLMFSVLVLAGCSGGGGGEQPQPTAEIKIDVPTIELSTPDAGNASATFSSSVAWSISLSDTKATPTWLRVDKTSGGAGTHTINISIVEPNPSVTDVRTGYVKIAAGDKVGVITVVQPKSIPVIVTGVALNKTELTLEVDKSEVLTATITPANATNKKVTWKSDDETIATVVNGTVTAKKIGTTKITVTTEDGGKTAECIVTVEPTAVTGITLNKTEIIILKGDSYTLVATIVPANATNKKVTWQSADETIATVVNGTVTAKKAGNTVITVTTEDGGKTATCTVEVKNPVDGDGTITDWE